ncbi:hypothetical protein M407DRAFT_32746 [Tulasnella calospora MUT 4182]|uniref:Uncharacterized protein n=1 Tax=Tulasnella calospora MUT 4182 TaxID=1051891 RepID=A0A0C3Q479_9AGAM|nr:hypothetical protein M407DRAFT_32746 [Tulasnella calospora MUT 4182]
MRQWNGTIIAEARKWRGSGLMFHDINGGLNKSRVLEVSGQFKQGIRVSAYAYRVAGQTMWVDRAWKALISSASFGEKGNNWNTVHFLDVTEFTATFACLDRPAEGDYPDCQLGLQYGLEVYAKNAAYGWWTAAHGNWKCVCNSSLTIGAVTSLGDDTSNTASGILNYTIPNTVANCASAARTALWTRNLLSPSPRLDNGNHGPKTANAMFLHSPEFHNQHERPDATEPWSMFWYDPAVFGAYWNGLALDHYFDDSSDS